MSRRRNQRNRHEVPELNITAFLNLMVVLIPFLLLSAAFNQLTILDLYLPTTGADDEQQARDERPELEVIIRAQSLVVADQKKGPYLSLAASNGSYDFAKLQKALLTIKSRNTDLTQITLLSEPEITYNLIVEVMDRVRQTRTTKNGTPLNVELFPDIALGDAPLLEQDAQQ
ncbi:MAG: biopolymer transporter ExbD [Motiliproteus sp.]